jgi:N-acetylneuraminic acid mutarotase
VGIWKLLPPAPIKGYYDATGVWTDSEFVIADRPPQNATGYGCVTKAAAYDPSTNTWRKLPDPPLTEGVLGQDPNPVGCFDGGDRAVWTGSEVILWGITNEAYNPATNSWRALPRHKGDDPVGAGSGVVWTGSQMIGFGGGVSGWAHTALGAYLPSTDSWRPIPSGPLSERLGAAVAWTGTEMVVAGGGPPPAAYSDWYADAAAYDPATRTWRKLPPMPEARAGATATWDGTEVLVVGGSTKQSAGKPVASGVAYNPATNAWRRLPPMELAREGQVAVWTGSQLLVWGGADVTPQHGEAFDPVTNRWTPLPRAPLTGRAGAVGVWSETSMIVWGGSHDGKQFNDGASFTP